MKKIDIPERDTVPLDAIAPDIAGIRIVFVNVFALAGASGVDLIECGLNGSAAFIKRWARQHFGERAPDAIVLTHAHFDHPILTRIQLWAAA